MTSNFTHNIKSIITQLALLLLCIYGILLINMEMKVKKIKDNITQTTNLGIKFNETKNLPTLQQKLFLDFNAVNALEKETSTIADTTYKKVNNKLDFNKTKIESLEVALTKLNLLQKKDINYNGNIVDVTVEQDTAIEGYKQIIDNYRKTNPSLNPLVGITRPELITKVNKMSISDLVGQLFIIGVDGTELSDQEKQGLIDFKPSGVILMGKNIDNDGQIKNLTAQLRATNPQTPLLIATDQEGGEVKRVGWDTVPAQNTWANESKDKMCEFGTNRAGLLSQLGINLNFAPVVDIGSSNPAFINSRTISTDYNVVTTKTREYRECFDKKVMSTLKHFPGHGTVTGDSHSSIPSNPDITKAEWDITHAEPFLKNLDASFIMSAHFILNKIDTKPASMSSIWINDILKKEYRYKGLVITDDMQQYYDISKNDINNSALDALNAGNDMILYVPNYSAVAPIKESLVNYYSNKKGLLESMVQKILLAKTQII
jgi:beta-N-acetylhexosaminidase